MSKTALGTLKLIVGTGESTVISAALRERVPESEIRAIGKCALLVHTPLATEELRDWLAGRIAPGHSLLVVEFERWSGYGKAVDSVWLLERGH